MFFVYFLFPVVNRYYRKKKKKILNRAKYYYENDKERLRDNGRDKYRNFSEEEKER